MWSTGSEAVTPTSPALSTVNPRHHDCQKMLEYGNAMAAIKHSVIGDMVFTDLEEIDGIIAQHKDTSGFQPEMNR